MGSEKSHLPLLTEGRPPGPGSPGATSFMKMSRWTARILAAKSGPDRVDTFGLPDPDRVGDDVAVASLVAV